MNPLNFVAVILKVFLVNLELCQRFCKNKKRLENKKRQKTYKNVTKIKKVKKRFFYICGIKCVKWLALTFIMSSALLA